MDLERTKPKQHDKLDGNDALNIAGLVKAAFDAADCTQRFTTWLRNYMSLFLRSFPVKSVI
jgi:hypothetical protein